MSTATVARTPNDRSPGPGGSVRVQPVSQGQVIRSEWIKFRTLRSSWYVMGGTVVGVAVIGMLVSYFTRTHFTQMSSGDRAGFNPIDASLTGVNFAQLTVGVLGVLVVSGEYSTGMIRATLAAVPRRLPVLVAKGLVFASVAFVCSLVATFVAYAIGQSLLGSHGVSLGHAGGPRAVVGAALYLSVVALAGMALGFIVRSTAGGIASLFGLLLILPVIVQALPQSWSRTIGPYMPSTAGGAVYTQHSDRAMLSPWVGLGVFCLYTAVLLTVAAALLQRRDA